jgi:hypothetical protein
LKELKTKKVQWNKYPVLAFSGIRPNGTAAVGAWVGLNSADGLTFFFDFRGRSKNGKLVPEDQRIWDDILRETDGFP